MKAALQRLGRTLLELLVRLLFWPGKQLPFDAQSVKRVLVVRPDPRVGNVLLTVPLVRALKAGLPHARVDLLIAEGKQPLVDGLPFLDGLAIFNKFDAFRAPWRLLGFLGRLRAAKYDLAVEAGHFHAFSFTGAALTRLTGARYRVGHDRGLAARFLTHAVAHDPKVVNDVEAKLELLQPLGLAPAGTELETLLGREGPAVLRLLSEKLPKEPFAALNIGARKADHRWPAQHFGALAARLAARKLVPLILWGPGEEGLAQEVIAASGGKAVLGPPTNLEELAAAFRVAAVVVANDTGPMHLASAVGARLVCCFMAEDGERWAHPGPRFAGVKVREVSDPVADVEAAAVRLLG